VVLFFLSRLVDLADFLPQREPPMDGAFAAGAGGALGGAAPPPSTGVNNR